MKITNFLNNALKEIRISRFQKKELQKYVGMTYKQLMELKGRVYIDSPTNLKDEIFARKIYLVEDDDLEVNILHILERGESFTEEQIQSAKEPDDEFIDLLEKMEEEGIDPETKFLESSSGWWFTIDSNNRIEWPSFEHDPYD